MDMGRSSLSSSLRNAGLAPAPITADACCRQNCGPNIAQHGHSWLWVPARASLGRDDGAFVLRLNFFKELKRYASAFPRRDAPESCMKDSPLKNRGRGECR